MKRTILAILIMISTTGYSQIADSAKRTTRYYSRQKEISLLVGFNQGKYSFADIGFAINDYGAHRHPFSFDYFISNEIRIGNKMIIGPKIGAWVAGGTAMGVNMIWYTDFDNSSLVLRPEIGIGFAKAKLVYGYNWQLTNRSFSGISAHLVSLVYCFKLKRLSSVTRPLNQSALSLQ